MFHLAGLPMSPEDVHIRVIRLGHAIQVGLGEELPAVERKWLAVVQ